jgi:hypothetical protein
MKVVVATQEKRCISKYKADEAEFNKNQHLAASMLEKLIF